jgi:hypothetical protein
MLIIAVLVDPSAKGYAKLVTSFGIHWIDGLSTEVSHLPPLTLGER